MELRYCYGCTIGSLTVDGTEEIHLTDEKRREVIDMIFKWYDRHPQELNSLLQHFVELYGEYKSLGYCETCGDTPTEYTITI